MQDFGFEVRRIKDFFYIDFDEGVVLMDDDSDRALETMDNFIAAAQKARGELARMAVDE